jgi:hypothetical protein
MIIGLELPTQTILEPLIAASVQIETNNPVKTTILKYSKILMFGIRLLPFRSDSLYRKLTKSAQMLATRKIIKLEICLLKRKVKITEKVIS